MLPRCAVVQLAAYPICMPSPSLACVAGGIVCAKFEWRRREGNGEKRFEIPPTGELRFLFFAYSRALNSDWLRAVNTSVK